MEVQPLKPPADQGRQSTARPLPRTFIRGAVFFSLLLVAVVTAVVVHVVHGGREDAGAWSGPVDDALTRGVRGVALNDVATMLGEARVTRAVLVPLPVVARGGQIRVRAELASAARICHSWPDLLWVASPGYLTGQDGSGWSQIDAVKAVTAQGTWACIGPVVLRAADELTGPTTPSGIVTCNVDGTAVLKWFRFAGTRHVPVFIRWDVVGDKAALPRLERLLSDFKDVTFIVMHMGFGNPEQISEILGSHSNVYVTTSKRLWPGQRLRDGRLAAQQGPSLLDDRGVLRPVWRSVLIQYYDRVLFATDTSTPQAWSAYDAAIRDGRHFLGQFPHNVAQAIAWQNAERVFASEHSTR